MTKKELKKKREEIVAAYIEKFGYYPAYLLRGASDQMIIEALEPCLESGEEYEAPDPDADY